VFRSPLSPHIAYNKRHTAPTHSTKSCSRQENKVGAGHGSDSPAFFEAESARFGLVAWVTVQVHRKLSHSKHRASLMGSRNGAGGTRRGNNLAHQFTFRERLLTFPRSASNGFQLGAYLPMKPNLGRK